MSPQPSEVRSGGHGDRARGPGVAVALAGIGTLGPGWADWDGAAALLRDASTPPLPATAVPAPQRLPATERRRAGAIVKVSVAVADAALAAAHAAGVAVDAAALPTVFTSSAGDPLNCHLLCEALAARERLVSPTRFTNSVHNAAAGYWHIATASRAPSTSLAAFDASFSAGLLEAAVQCRAAAGAVLLVAADVPYPQPLHALRPLADAVGVALLLVPPRPGLRTLTIEADAGEHAAPTALADAALAAVVRSVPAARALPLLHALAHGAAAAVVLEGPPGQPLAVHVAAAPAAGIDEAAA